MMKIATELFNSDYVFTDREHALDNNVYANEVEEKVVDICK